MASTILGGSLDARNPGVWLDGGASAKPGRGALLRTAMRVLVAAAALVVAGRSAAAKDDADVPWVMNVVNFMRGCEPRAPRRDLTKVLAEEIWFNNFYGLPNTILLQSASDGRQSA